MIVLTKYSLLFSIILFSDVTACSTNAVGLDESVSDCLSISLSRKDEEIEFKAQDAQTGVSHDVSIVPYEAHDSSTSQSGCPLSRTAAMFERYSIYNLKIKIKNLDWIKLNQISDSLLSQIISRKIKFETKQTRDPTTNFNILKGPSH